MPVKGLSGQVNRQYPRSRIGMENQKNASNSLAHSEIVNRKDTNFHRIAPSPGKNKGKEDGIGGLDNNNWEEFFPGPVD